MMKKKKILVLCPYPEDVAPSQRLKFEQYYQFFRDAGYELTIRPFISKGFWKIIYKEGYFLQKVRYTIAGYLLRLADLLAMRKYDIVYVHLWVTPFGPPLFERITRRLSKKIIFDIDDLVYLKGIDGKSSKLARYLKGVNKPIYLMKVSDHVITCTPFLDEFVKKLNKNTTDISSTVDTDIYKPRHDYSNQEEKLVIGWSGSLSTSKYLKLLGSVFRKLKTKIDFKLVVLGDADVKIDGVEIEAYAWTKELEVQTIQRFDIGVYPLPDEQWVYGKSGLKAIQYMAMGIPTVATGIGANFRVIEDEESGFLVRSEDEWVKRVIELATDVRLRAKIGGNARKRVEEKFSIKSNKQVYLDILDRVSGGN